MAMNTWMGTKTVLKLPGGVDKTTDFQLNNMKKSIIAESRDSCYSSCSDDSHSSASRKASTCSTEEAVKPIDGQAHIKFATRLAYTEEQLSVVLANLGLHADQEKILSELIKLGNNGASFCPNKEINHAAMIEQRSLRSIVIDGSNIAMTHGHKEVFSCKGIRECVNFFRDRGHSDIIVFVPHFRHETPRSDCPITDQHILFTLEKENILVWTPSRRINGRRIVCHDDRYILKTANEKDAVIVSNDEYRDLIKKDPQLRRLVEQRLLMYSFVDGKFMPPDDPLGRYGPTLEQFLSKGYQPLFNQQCPYARRCTYGNKCKYFHPERPNGIYMSATERIMKAKQQKKMDLLATSDSIRGSSQHGSEGSKETNMMRTDKFPENKLVGNDIYASVKNSTGKRSMHYGKPENQQLVRSSSQPYNNFVHWNPAPTDFSAQSYMSFAPYNGDALYYPYHSQLSRSHPIPYSCFTLPKTADVNKYTTKQCFFEEIIQSTEGCQSLFTPSTAVELCVRPHLVPLAPQNSPQIYSRFQLQQFLCQLFPHSVVLAIMQAYPNENSLQTLCSQIIKIQEGLLTVNN